MKRCTHRAQWRRAILVGVVGLLMQVGVPAVRAWEKSTPAATEVHMVVPPGEASQYWPRWRGPSGQGLAGAGDYPDTWSDTQNVLWKVELPGRGNSSPILWKDRLFLTTAYEAGKRRSILCLRRDDGQRLWETFAPAARPERAQGKNGYASGTPCTDGERVYAYFGNHGLLCVDFAGQQVWHHSFGELDAFHGTSCSPLLHGDRVIVFQDNRSPSGSFVAALDKRTGKVLWRTPRKERVGWGSAVAVRVDDHDEIIVSSQHRVCAYDPTTGKELWTCAGNLVEVTPTPVVGHGLIFCCSGRAGPTLAIRPGGAGDVTQTHLAWKANTGSPFIPSPLLYGDYLYMVNDIVSVARCYEARTGKLLWQERLGRAVQHGFSASPVAVAGKVFFTNDAGETYVLAAGPEFQLLHVNKLNAPTLASPALLDGRWYFRTDRHLLCIGKGKE
jgi:outer membrane protein assembly factor BamB